MANQPWKKLLFTSLINRGKTVYLTVDTNYPGVSLPEHLYSKLVVALLVSRALASVITMEETSMSLVLHFNGKPHNVILPYKAIGKMCDEANRNKVIESNVIHLSAYRNKSS